MRVLFCVDGSDLALQAAATAARLLKGLRPEVTVLYVLPEVDGRLRHYERLHETFRRIEAMGDEEFRVVVKWNRIANEGKREYSRCYGPPFIMQLSGNGLIAPCGFLFNERYKAFHIGNICDTRFRDLWASDRYWEVMRYLASDEFDPRKRCGPNCLQDRANDFLYRYVNGKASLPDTPAPPHLGFI